MNATKFLIELGVENPAGILKSIEHAEMKAIYKKNSVLVMFFIKSKMYEEIKSSIAMPLRI